MLNYLLTPPGLYFLIVGIFVISLIVYWKRTAIKREVGRWRTKEVTAGPIKLERKTEPEAESVEKAPHPQTSGVHLSGDFTGSKVRKLTGGANVKGRSVTKARRSSPGVVIEGKYRDTELEDIVGGDRIDET